MFPDNSWQLELRRRRKKKNLQAKGNIDGHFPIQEQRKPEHNEDGKDVSSLLNLQSARVVVDPLVHTLMNERNVIKKENAILTEKVRKFSNEGKRKILLNKKLQNEVSVLKEKICSLEMKAVEHVIEKKQFELDYLLMRTQVKTGRAEVDFLLKKLEDGGIIYTPVDQTTQTDFE